MTPMRVVFDQPFILSDFAGAPETERKGKRRARAQTRVLGWFDDVLAARNGDSELRLRFGRMTFFVPFFLSFSKNSGKSCFGWSKPPAGQGSGARNLIMAGKTGSKVRRMGP